MTTHELWQAVLGELELTLSKANFTTWFRSTAIASCDDQKVVISVPNTFTKAWLEKKYNVAILKSIQNVTKCPVKEVVYQVDVRQQSKPSFVTDGFVPQYDSAMPQLTTQVNSLVLDKKEAFLEAKLNPKYTFETFVVGKGNELANAAALAVAENPGIKYNPLFIYGGVGLGKTHVAQAIGNELLRKNASAKVLYVTCEKFTNEFIHAVKTGHGKEFKDTYRTVDLLIIDDIQFLTGRD